MMFVAKHLEQNHNYCPINRCSNKLLPETAQVIVKVQTNRRHFEMNSKIHHRHFLFTTAHLPSFDSCLKLCTRSQLDVTSETWLIGVYFFCFYVYLSVAEGLLTVRYPICSLCVFLCVWSLVMCVIVYIWTADKINTPKTNSFRTIPSRYDTGEILIKC